MKLNDVGSFAVKDLQGMSEKAPSDEDGLINGVKWNSGYFDHDQTDDYLQLVPEIHTEEEKSKESLFFVVPDEHSETEDHLHHHIRDFSYSSDKRCYSRNKHEKSKKRRIHISSDEESEDFTREVPSVTRKGYKRRRRREEMSDKMRKLQQLVPNCHKIDMVSVLDKTIEYMKNLQLQHQVMSIMGMNPYFTPATLDFVTYNHLLTVAHGQHPANQAPSSPLFPALNLPLPPFTNLSFPHSTAASSPQCDNCGLTSYFQPR